MSELTHHDEIAAVYDRGRRAAASDVIYGLMKGYSNKTMNDTRLLDVGGGTGNYALTALEFGVGHVTLLDVSEAMMVRARGKLEGYKDRVQFRIAKAPPLPFEDNSFDAVMMNQVLNHLDPGTHEMRFPGAQQLFAETRRVLRPGGFLGITNMSTAQAIAPWFMHLIPDTLKRVAPLFPPLEDVRNFLAACQFNVLTPITCMGSDAYLDYLNCEGPLDPVWRTFSYMCLATPEELERGLTLTRQLKESGKLEEFMRTHDGITDKLGCFYIQAAIAPK